VAEERTIEQILEALRDAIEPSVESMEKNQRQAK
jgi:hypothetical protein